MATVVEVLPVTPEVSSTPTLTLVIAASVVSGAISEIEPTKVVLPTAKPPATTILTGMGPSALGSSKCLEAIEHPFEQSEVGAVPDVVRTVDRDVALAREVAHEHPGDAEVQAQVGGDLRDRHGGDAQRHDAGPLEGELSRFGLTLRRRADHRLDGQVGAGTSASAREGVRADADTQIRLGVVRHRGKAPCNSARSSGVRTAPVLSTSTAIS